MPKMLDREDFRRWFRSLDNVSDWVRTELEQLEQIHIAELDLQTARRFRREFWGHFGIRR
jgi:hypothetical protein